MTLYYGSANHPMFDHAWDDATPQDKQRVIEQINNHARNQSEAAEFFAMITGHQHEGSETDQ